MTDLAVRKPIRLARAAYDQPDATWLVTVAARNRNAHPFGVPDLAVQAVCAIESYVVRQNVTVFAGCLMPDHLHMVMATHGQSLIDVIGAIKSLTTHVWWRHGGVGAVWQRSFHDEGLRIPAAFDRATEYVLENPQVGGIVEDWRYYSYLFGTV